MKLDLQHVVNLYRSGEFADIQEYFAGDTSIHQYYGKVQVKQRPRLGRGGRTFTPEETRKFEKSVRDWAKKHVVTCVRYPIRVSVTVYEHGSIEMSEHSMAGLVYGEKGDIDNLVKSILDGMNKVMYVDDKQIVDLRAKRQYRNEPGFSVAISRAGLSKAEYANFLKRVNK